MAPGAQRSTVAVGKWRKGKLMSRPLRVGVVGLGYIGELHCRILTQSARAELVAVTDINEQRAQEIAGWTKAKAYTQVSEMLRNEDLDAVNVCLPDLHHVDVAREVATRGIPMLLEKPVAHTAEAAYRIGEALLASGSLCQINHVLRSDPRYVLAHAQSEPGKLGELIHVRAARNSVGALARHLGKSTSILFYLGVHDVDAVQWMARSQISSVFARSVNKFGHANEDAIFVSFTMENGAIGTLEYSWAWPEGLLGGFNQQIELVGTKGAASVDTRMEGLRAVNQTGEMSEDTFLWPEVNGRIGGCLRDNIENFLIAVQSGGPLLQDWRDGISAVEVLDAIRQSVREGREVAVVRRSQGAGREINGND